MPGPLTKVLGSLMGLAGCAAADPGESLVAIGAETQAPPAAERRAIEAAIAGWAPGRFTPGAPRWFVLKSGTPAVAVLKAVDNSLADHARRITESGPDGADAVLYGWRLKAPDKQGHDALVAAVSRTDPALAAYYPVKLSGRWPD